MTLKFVTFAFVLKQHTFEYSGTEAQRVRRIANDALRAALSSGELTKEPCCVCGTDIHVHAHHDDYSRPNVIAWLCAKHHADRHVELNGGAPRKALSRQRTKQLDYKRRGLCQRCAKPASAKTLCDVCTIKDRLRARNRIGAKPRTDSLEVTTGTILDCIGGTVRLLRRERGINERRLAQLSGQKAGEISRLERLGGGASIPRLTAIAGAFGMKLSELITQHETRAAKKRAVTATA